MYNGFYIITWGGVKSFLLNFILCLREKNLYNFAAQYFCHIYISKKIKHRKLMTYYIIIMISVIIIPMYYIKRLFISATENKEDHLWLLSSPI